jgi:hypothetical protein
MNLRFPTVNTRYVLELNARKKKMAEAKHFGYR